MNKDSSYVLLHQEQHWRGDYWGERGAVCRGLIQILSTLYSASKSASTFKRKLGVLIGESVLYVVVRTLYRTEKLSPSSLDALASVSRRFRRPRHAIRCALVALESNPTFTTRMLLVAGLVRDFSAIGDATRAEECFCILMRERSTKAYNPPQQEIRVLRAMAWYTKNSREETFALSEVYVRQAFALARMYDARDLEYVLTQEFGPAQ
jgi:hypothetical protein